MAKMYNVYDEDFREKLLDMPIKALDLPREVYLAVSSFTNINITANTISKIETIRDLLKRGKENISENLSRAKFFNVNSNMIRDIEEKLMKFGLKFQDSDYSALDVRVKELDIAPETKKYLDGLVGIETIGDVSIQNLKILKSRVKNDDYSPIVDLKNAMEEYGVKFADAKYDVDQSRCFPVKNKIYYMHGGIVDEYLDNYKPKRKPAKSLDSLNKELRKKINEDEM